MKQRIMGQGPLCENGRRCCTRNDPYQRKTNVNGGLGHNSDDLRVTCVDCGASWLFKPSTSDIWILVREERSA